MASHDEVPAEVDLDRGGPQLTAAEAREVARPGAGAARPQGSTGGDRALDRPDADAGRDGGEHTAGPAAEQALSNPEAALGGADAVQKTSYGVGEGTEPDGREYAPAGLRKGESATVPKPASEDGGRGTA